MLHFGSNILQLKLLANLRPILLPRRHPVHNIDNSPVRHVIAQTSEDGEFSNQILAPIAVPPLLSPPCSKLD